MNKKILLSTTIASTMLVTSAVMPITRAATDKVSEYRFSNGWVKEGISSLAVELKAPEKMLTKADVEELVKAKYPNDTIANITKGETVIENSTDPVGTGAVVKLSSGKEITVVLFGDVDGDGDIDLTDSTAILLQSDGVQELTTGEAGMKAADVVEMSDTEEEKVNLTDSTKVLLYNDDVVPDLVDAVKLPEEEVEKLEYTLKAEEVTPNADKALQDVIVEAETDEITLNVLSSKLVASTPLKFTLKNVPADTSLSGEEITGAFKANSTDMEVTVPARVGDYTFTLTKDGKVKTVIVHVVDSTSPTGYVFKTWRDEDINTINDEKYVAKENTTVVKAASGLFADNKEEEEATSGITFKGNVNTMNPSEDGGKYYRVRVLIKGGLKANQVKAMKNDGVTEYYSEPVPNNEYELYVYLDANEASTALVLVNKNASAKQVKAENTSKHTVNFESISKIWLRKVRTSTDTSTFKNVDKITRTDLNADNHTIDVGVKFSELQGLELKEENGKVTVTTKENGEKWIPITVILNNATGGQQVREAVYATGNENIKIDRVVTVANNEDAIVVWVKADEATPEIEFKLIYNRANEVNEELPVKIILHDATTPIIRFANPGKDVNSKGILMGELEAMTEEKITDSEHQFGNATAVYNVNVDTYKYAMDEITMKGEKGEAVKGRWYSLVLETNVPVSSLVYNDGTDTNPNWKPLPATEENTVTIWIDRDATEGKTTRSVQQTIANKWAIEKDADGNIKTGSDAKNWTVGVTVTENEKTNLQMEEDYQIGGIYVNENCNYDHSGLLGNISIVEPNLPIESEKYTLKNNLTVSKIGKDKITRNTNNTISTVEIDVSKVSTINVNGIDGQWIVMYITSSGKDLVDENGEKKFESGIYVDAANASNLLTNTTHAHDNTNCHVSGSAVTFNCIPVWINLSNPEVQKAISKEGNTNPIEINFGYKSPVEEHNVCKVNFKDTSKADLPEINEELSKLTAPSITENDIKDNEEKQEEVYDKWISGDAGFNSSSDKTDVENLVKNMEVLNDKEKTNITKQVIDNTIYVKVETKLDEIQQVDSKYTLPLMLDISMLNVEDGDLYICVPDNVWSKTWSEDSTATEFACSFGFEDLEGGNIKEVYLTRASSLPSGTCDLDQVTTPYVHYIIEFVQK